MFKFFPDDSKEESNVDKEGKAVKSKLNVSKEILIGDFHSKLVSVLTNHQGSSIIGVKVSKTENLKCVNLSELSGIDQVFSNEGSENVKNILRSATDLVPGEYEGGFKTWECTFDLIDYLEANWGNIFEKTEPLRILDMGCGSGLVGLAVLRLAEKLGVNVTVDFQDYNDEVINYVTIPNTLLNFKDEMAARCRFFAGDWDSFKDLFQEVSISKSQSGGGNPHYDLILSSETIYNLDYFPKFLRLVKSCLKDDGGDLYLAAKTFYFGVGGGTKAFLNMVNEDEVLEASVVRVIKQGVQREIIRCRKKTIAA